MYNPSSNTIIPTEHHTALSQRKRVESIDLLRGLVMIIMALDHVRDYFHYDAFLYDPTDLSRTNGPLFFTRFITHYCAPVFVFLAGISARLNGNRKTKRELANYLFTRGLWLILVELIIISFGRTFNPAFPFFNLQVIWAIGISMIVLSTLIFFNNNIILLAGVVLVSAHNLLDTIHVTNRGILSFLWALLHETGQFTFGNKTINVLYPVLPWIGIMAIGYCCGELYHRSYKQSKRKKILLTAGFSSIALFFVLRMGNIYGDMAYWSEQKNTFFSLLSVLNVSKYPPSLLYTLITLGPTLIFLALCEKQLNAFTKKIALYGKVPFFYYVVHIYLIHLLAVFASVISGYDWQAMIISGRVNSMPQLKGYGFSLFAVYSIWISLIVFLYPFCKWFNQYKTMHLKNKAWLQFV